MTTTIKIKIGGTEYRLVPDGSMDRATVYYIRRGSWRRMKDPESIKRVIRYVVQEMGE